MKSRFHWLAGLTVGILATSASAAPVPAPEPGKYEPPTLTFHTMPGVKVLADVKAYVKLLGGDMAAKKLDETLSGYFGKPTIPGVDLTRSLCGYVYLRPSMIESQGVFVIPTTGEKDALTVLQKMQLMPREVKNVTGRYRLGSPEEGFPTPMYAQFVDGGKLMYISINAKPDILEKDKLIPLAKLVDTKATKHLTITAYPDRVPNAVRQMVFQFLDLELMAELDRMEQRKPQGMPVSFPSFMKEWLKLGKRSLASLFTECETVVLTQHLNTKSANIESEYIFTPKSNTPFAKDIAAIKAPVGRFHQLKTKDSVLGGWMVLPTPLPKELRAQGGAFLKEWLNIFGADAPKEAAPLFAAVAKQVEKAVASGNVDGGFGLVGPNKAGLYSGVAAVAVEDSKDIEKAFRTAAKAAGEFVKLDAAKVDGVAVHEITTTPAQTPDLVRVFGKDFKLLLAFSKDAVYAAVGPDAESELKRAMNLKPKVGPAFDITAHAARAVKLLTPNQFTTQIVALGSRIEDFISYVALDVSGGKELRVKSNSGALLMMFFGFTVRQEFQAVPGNVVPPPPPPPLPIKKN